MIYASDSQNPSAPADMPLYAVLQDGKFYLLQVEDTPCLTLTADGRVELHHYKPTLAVSQPFDGTYECPFCFSLCARDYCTGCQSSLLVEEQGGYVKPGSGFISGWRTSTDDEL
jgi:hypothetical protein